MRGWRKVVSLGSRGRKHGRFAGAIALICLACSLALTPRASEAAPSLAATGARPPIHPVTYRHDDIPEGPWSIHIVKIDRSNHDFELQSALAGGSRFGLATLSEQAREIPPDWGKPVAGLNGDFFKRSDPYLGDPKGLQIMHGELVSGPCDWSCFWIEPDGTPHVTNVVALFQVTWPTGEKTPFGLNEACPRDGAVLYTAVVGSHTQTSGGRELILERDGTNAFLPLKPSLLFPVRVREVREGGDSAIPRGALVLSLGRSLAGHTPAVRPGDVLQISTLTWPELKGVQTAIGGGPALLRGGRIVERNQPAVRHPRSAIGWNKDFFFLVEVDGRQRDLSVGMTLDEFSAYLVKIGCTDAMNLDGGGSATCWVYGQVMNSPSEGRDRGMGNAIFVTQKERD